MLENGQKTAPQHDGVHEKFKRAMIAAGPSLFAPRGPFYKL